MKRFVTLVLSALMILPVFAGKTQKAWTFALYDDGECVVERSFDTDNDAQAALKAFKVVLNKVTLESRSTINEVPGESILYELKKNTKTRYNPFAGNFNESMQFKMAVTYADGKVLVRLYDINLENKYEGYGKNVRNDTFSGKIAEYEEAAETAATAKGKEKKEAEEVMENINDSLNMCEEEMNKIFNAFAKALK
jgi:hypothetical protein